MNSRLIRVLIVVIGIAIGLSAGYFFKDIDSDITAQRASADMLREQAAALTATIADLRAGQVAYVARGQGEAFWMSHVASSADAPEAAPSFGASLTAPAAQSAFEPAAAALENFRTLDARVKEFVQSGSSLLAADMIFSEGSKRRPPRRRRSTTALNEELQHRNRSIAAIRSRQLAILGGGAGVILLLMVVLAFMGTAASKTAEPEVAAVPADRAGQVRSAAAQGESGRHAEADHHRAALPRAGARRRQQAAACSARTCGEGARRIGHHRVGGRAVAPGAPSGAFARIRDQIVARMGSIHRDANNAVAAAYRSSEVRTVAGDAITNGAAHRSADDQRRMRRRDVRRNEERLGKGRELPRPSPQSSPPSSRRSSQRPPAVPVKDAAQA